MSGSFEIDRWLDWFSFVWVIMLFCCLARLVEGHSDTWLLCEIKTVLFALREGIYLFWL